MLPATLINYNTVKRWTAVMGNRIRDLCTSVHFYPQSKHNGTERISGIRSAGGDFNVWSRARKSQKGSPPPDEMMLMIRMLMIIAIISRLCAIDTIKREKSVPPTQGHRRMRWKEGNVVIRRIVNIAKPCKRRGWMERFSREKKVIFAIDQVEKKN